jgi:hypothetical protein
MQPFFSPLVHQSQALSAPLSALNLDALARLTGLVRRRPKKVHPLSFLQTCCLLALQSTVSLSGWACLWGMLTASTLSKQAVAKRCSAGAVDFLRLVLQTLLAGLWRPPASLPKALSSFRRVLIQDSTTLALAPKLAARFPGSRNQLHKDTASLKVQALYDLLSEHFVHFALTPFTTNDQKASPMILELARAGDLVIRDLGYAVLSVFKNAQAQGIYFLSRLRYGTALFGWSTGQPLDLLKQLRDCGQWDGRVWLGAREKIPVRLVAVPVSEAVAAERRRKARANRDRRLNPSPEYLELLGWEIFITNVSAETWTASTVAAVYGVRWRIEIWFKAWKSHFRLGQLTAGSAQQIQLLVYGRLIWISLFQATLLRPVAQPPALSLLKLAAWCRDYALAWMLTAHHPLGPEQILTQILYHCRYDRRRKRRNFLQKLQCLS